MVGIAEELLPVSDAIVWPHSMLGLCLYFPYFIMMPIEILIKIRIGKTVTVDAAKN